MLVEMRTQETYDLHLQLGPNSAWHTLLLCTFHQCFLLVPGNLFHLYGSSRGPLPHRLRFLSDDDKLHRRIWPHEHIPHLSASISPGNSHPQHVHLVGKKVTPHLLIFLQFKANLSTRALDSFPSCLSGLLLHKLITFFPDLLTHPSLHPSLQCKIRYRYFCPEKPVLFLSLAMG